MATYKDYLAECKEAGVDPVEMNEWRSHQMRAAKLDEPKPESNPVEADPLDEYTDQIIFYSPHRYYVEVMQAGEKVMIGSSIAMKAHRIIEFTEHHWVADLSDSDARDKARYLLGSRALKNGAVSVIPDYHKIQSVQVQDGPRTAATTKQRVDRPAGELSAKL